ncbi:MAG: histidine kinase, partial [Cohnella sp.]|nr:histidine kinase [Cohnella sp.]
MMNIRTKLFLIQTVVVVLLLGSLTYVMERYSRNAILEKVRETAGYSVSQLSQNVDYLLKSYEQIADFLYTNDTLQDRLLRPYANYPESQQVYFDDVVPLLSSIRNSKEIADLTVYTTNASFLFPDIVLLEDTTRLAKWYRAQQPVPGAKSPKRWTMEEPAPGTRVLRLTQRLNHLNSEAELYAAFDVDIRLLAALTAKENAQYRFVIQLPDREVVFDSHASGEASGVGIVGSGNPADDDWLQPYLAEGPGNRVVRHEGLDYLFTAVRLDSRNSTNGLQVVSLIPLNELSAKVDEMRSIAVTLFVSALLLSLAINYLVSLGLTRRLRDMANRMKHLDMDRMQPIAPIRGRDEVSQLGLAFNGMVRRMQRLIGEVYESELNRKELELKTKESELYALQTQINPHYLFNTLNAIRGNLLEKGDRHHADIVGLLARSFRNILSKGGQTIRLAEELEIVETYLRIQQFRFEDRLAFRIAIPTPLQQQSVPKLALQTLVENAIVHGLE